ncbi:putative quinol monooxygenase [Rathayibacter sp. YIM 133350]|uniref:putative quinol monooxygenase n=1 Tax=Rathayibacter sp. YIM 133350 TaxID=3131992 RepID=UPI00307F31FF
MSADAGAPVVLFAEFTAHPGLAHRVGDLLAGFANDVRREPGTIAFDPCSRADAPHRFFVFECYRDRAAFQAHLDTEHGARFNAALRDLIVEDGSQLTFLTPL